MNNPTVPALALKGNTKKKPGCFSICYLIHSSSFTSLLNVTCLSCLQLESSFSSSFAYFFEEYIQTYGFKLHTDKFTISILSWLILRVNLTGLRDAQIAGKTLFLGL